MPNNLIGVNLLASRLPSTSAPLATNLAIDSDAFREKLNAFQLLAKKNPLFLAADVTLYASTLPTLHAQLCALHAQGKEIVQLVLPDQSVDPVLSPQAQNAPRSILKKSLQRFKVGRNE